MNKITSSTVEHIIKLGKIREDEDLDRESIGELFDSIDSLDADELAELSALVQIGKSDNLASFRELVCEAKKIGFPQVQVIFELGKLGSYLSKGYGIYCAEHI